MIMKYIITESQYEILKEQIDERVPKEKLVDIIERLQSCLSGVNFNDYKEKFEDEFDDNLKYPFEWFVRRIKKYIIYLAEDVYGFESGEYDYYMDNMNKEQVMTELFVNSLIWFFHKKVEYEYIEGEDFTEGDYSGFLTLVSEIFGDEIGEIYNELKNK